MRAAFPRAASWLLLTMLVLAPAPACSLLEAEGIAQEAHEGEHANEHEGEPGDEHADEQEGEPGDEHEGEAAEPFEQGVLDSGFDRLGISFSHGALAGQLPPHHRDPFDRMLIAQARTERLTLISGDQALRAYDLDLVLI